MSHERTRIARLATLSALIGLNAVRLVSGHVEKPQDDLSLARAVSAAYEDNRAKFISGTITFTYTDGICPESNAARQGKVKDRCDAAGEYAFNNARASYTRVFSVDVMEGATTRIGERQSSSRVSSIKCATDGLVSMLVDIYPAFMKDQRITQSGRIVAGPRDFYREAQLPLSVCAELEDRFDPPVLLRKALNGATGHRVLVAEEGHFEGTPVVKVVVEHPYGRASLWCDMDRGGIPRRCQFEGNRGSIAEYFQDDVRQVPSGGWYPFVTTMILGVNRIQRYEIISADFERPPGDSDFHLVFDAPVEISDAVKRLTYPRKSSWDLTSLPMPHSSGVVPFDPSPRPVAPTMQDERSSSSVSTQLFVGIAVAVAVAVSGWLLWRHNSNVAGHH